MAITVKSPYSGQPVKVRDQDIGRALRDEAGRVFYVVARSEGEGYYAARTRGGSAREEAAYEALGTPSAVAQPAGVEPAPVHDATGRRRVRPLLWLVLLLLLALVGYAVYLGYTRHVWTWPGAQKVPSTQPAVSGDRGVSSRAAAVGRARYDVFGAASGDAGFACDSVQGFFNVKRRPWVCKV